MQHLVGYQSAMGRINTWYQHELSMEMVTGYQAIAGAKILLYLRSGLMQKAGWFKINGKKLLSCSFKWCN